LKIKESKKHKFFFLLSETEQTQHCVTSDVRGVTPSSVVALSSPALVHLHPSRAAERFSDLGWSCIFSKMSTGKKKIIKQGYLTKQGGSFGGWKTWKKRCASFSFSRSSSLSFLSPLFAARPSHPPQTLFHIF
jgi:hypothetical protein